MFQHGFKIPAIFYHITVVYLATFFGKCFTSCPGIGSGILSENQNLFSHFSDLLLRAGHFRKLVNILFQMITKSYKSILPVVLFAVNNFELTNGSNLIDIYRFRTIDLW